MPPSTHSIDGRPRWLGREAPRYTSYPTAHHFSASVTPDDHAAWLRAIPSGGTFSCYVHVPFCREMCWFCGCHTKITQQDAPVTAYVETLRAEIDLIACHTGGRASCTTLHFGGGSPSLLTPALMSALLTDLTSLGPWQSDMELAIELDPRTVPLDHLAFYADAGFNRISLGIQDFDPRVQQAIHRIQPADLVHALVFRLRELGLSQINFDLIYGLPFQTQDSFAATLATTIALAPARIALFSYAHMPQLRKHQRMIPDHTLPSEETKAHLSLQASQTLEATGYVAIGIDHFALPSDPLVQAMRSRRLRRNFQGYVTDTAPVLIGLGASAISQFPQGYVQNAVALHSYAETISTARLASQRGCPLTQDDAVRKQIIDTLMCSLSVDLATVRAMFDLPPDAFAPELQVLDHPDFADLVQCRGEKIDFVSPYRMGVRLVAAVFDRYAGAPQGRYSRVA